MTDSYIYINDSLLISVYSVYRNMLHAFGNEKTKSVVVSLLLILSHVIICTNTS